jgi:DNA helicase TIP49 (TBP-interacting protein)
MIPVLLAAAIAGEHVLLLGPPGTGKSALSFRLYAVPVGSRVDPRAVGIVADEVVHLADALRDDLQVHHLFERL